MNKYLDSAELNHRLTKAVKTGLALALTGLFLWLLYSIPYQILREERIRAYGEKETVALVEETILATPDGNFTGTPRYTIIYYYEDQDGIGRRNQGHFNKEEFLALNPGDKIAVLYATGDPSLSRAQGESENDFRLWIRDFLQ